MPGKIAIFDHSLPGSMDVDSVAWAVVYLAMPNRRTGTGVVTANTRTRVGGDMAVLHEEVAARDGDSMVQGALTCATAQGELAHRCHIARHLQTVATAALYHDLFDWPAATNFNGLVQHEALLVDTGPYEDTRMRGGIFERLADAAILSAACFIHNDLFRG